DFAAEYWTFDSHADVFRLFGHDERAQKKESAAQMKEVGSRRNGERVPPTALTEMPQRTVAACSTTPHWYADRSRPVPRVQDKSTDWTRPQQEITERTSDVREMGNLQGW